MTQLRILELAKREAINRWHKEFERANKNTENKIAKAKAEKAWKELEQIENLYFKELNKIA